MKEWQVLIIIMPVPFLIWKYGVTIKNTHKKKNPSKNGGLDIGENISAVGLCNK